jgi:hypothetical protein
MFKNEEGNYNLTITNPIIYKRSKTNYSILVIDFQNLYPFMFLHNNL